MKFGVVKLAEAQGAILAHSQNVKTGGKRRKIPKGSVISAADIEALERAGHASITVARLDRDDMKEDEAAAQIAKAATGRDVVARPAFTGRVNLVAARAGVVLINQDLVNGFNAIDESLTLATLRPFEAVTEGQILATVKIIPLGAPSTAVNAGVAVLDAGAAVSVAPFSSRKVGLVSTELPGLKVSLYNKTRQALEARLLKSGSTLVAERRVAHEPAAVAEALTGLIEAGADLLVAFSASAVVDRADVVPGGLVAAGGRIEYFGMPVDPGNLLVLGDLNGVPVIGAPSCARSPKLNGFDWVLDRLVAGLALSATDISAMGVGGLLKEIASRPHPRAAVRSPANPRRKRIAGILLAAGRSARMGADNKLTLDFRGRPMVRWAAEAASASLGSELVVVTGHQDSVVREALSGIDARFIHNPDYADGLSTSLGAGLKALGGDVDGALIVLGDMPGVSAKDLERIVAAFDPEAERAIIVPTYAGRRGNPVLWAARFFPELMALQGDVGARHLIGEHDECVAEVELGRGVVADIDTPQALADARAGVADELE